MASLNLLFYPNLRHRFTPIKVIKLVYNGQAVVVHTFNLSTQEAESGGSVSLKPAWSTEQIPGQPELFSR